jgi:hypothetical protein
MEKKLKMEGTILSFSSYKAKQGQEDALMELVKSHLPKLRELGLATDRNNYVAKSTDGRIIEVFEWASSNAVNAAHQHPAISDIWEKMTLVADFLPMNSLPEGNAPFVSFEMVK